MGSIGICARVVRVTGLTVGLNQWLAHQVMFAVVISMKNKTITLVTFKRGKQLKLILDALDVKWGTLGFRLYIKGKLQTCKGCKKVMTLRNIGHIMPSKGKGPVKPIFYCDNTCCTLEVTMNYFE